MRTLLLCGVATLAFAAGACLITADDNYTVAAGGGGGSKASSSSSASGSSSASATTSTSGGCTVGPSDPGSNCSAFLSEECSQECAACAESQNCPACVKNDCGQVAESDTLWACLSQKCPLACGVTICRPGGEYLSLGASCTSCLHSSAAAQCVDAAGIDCQNYEDCIKFQACVGPCQGDAGCQQQCDQQHVLGAGDSARAFIDHCVCTGAAPCMNVCP